MTSVVTYASHRLIAYYLFALLMTDHVRADNADAVIESNSRKTCESLTRVEDYLIEFVDRTKPWIELDQSSVLQLLDAIGSLKVGECHSGAPRPDVLLIEPLKVRLIIEKIERKSPDDFVTPPYKCVGDFVRCQELFKHTSPFDYQFGCGTVYLVCIGSSIIK